jgi:hypothetical protein
MTSLFRVSEESGEFLVMTSPAEIEPPLVRGRIDPASLPTVGIPRVVRSDRLFQTSRELGRIGDAEGIQNHSCTDEMVFPYRVASGENWENELCPCRGVLVNTASTFRLRDGEAEVPQHNIELVIGGFRHLMLLTRGDRQKSSDRRRRSRAATEGGPYKTKALVL